MTDDENRQRQFRKALELQDRIEQDHTAAKRAQYLHSRRLQLEEAFYEVQLAERSFQAELWWHTRCAGWRHYSQDLQEAVDLGYDMFNSWSGHVNKRVTSRSEETVQDPDYSARRRANRMDKAISQPIDDGVKAANRRSSLPIRVASSSDTSPPGPSPVAVLYEWHAAITNVERATDEQFAVNFSALHNDLQTFMHDREADDEHRGDRTRDWVFYQPEREFISGSQSPLKMGIRL